MLIETTVFSKSEKDYEKIKGIIDGACEELCNKRDFLAHEAFRNSSIEEDDLFAQILVCTRSENDFETAKSFLYWAFEDYRRKHGFLVRYEIKHIRMDAPGLRKGKGEE